MRNKFATTDKLIRALSNGEFEPYLQPIVSASKLTISGAELLVRWHMPTGEIFPPAYFIHQADSAGLLSLMTGKILNRTTAAWRLQIENRPGSSCCCRTPRRICML
ncbi:EAL domain-containing protein [Escherichia coli]